MELKKFSLRKILLLLVGAIAGCYLAIWLYAMIMAVAMPGMNEYREQAQADAIYMIGHGINLFPDNAEGTFYLYGFMFPLISSLVEWLTGVSSLMAGRLVSLMATLGIMGLGSHVVTKNINCRLEKVVVFLVSASWLSLTWYRLGLADPATVGTLIMVGAICCATAGWSIAGTLSCALLTWLGFYCKAYFVGVFAPIFIYLFLMNRRQAWLYVGMFAAIGVALFYIIKCIWPSYFVYNYLHHSNMAGHSLQSLVCQLKDLLVYWWALPLVIIVGGVFYVKKEGVRPLISNKWFLSTLIWFLMFLRLGLHQGAYLTYMFQTFIVTGAILALKIISNLDSDKLKIALAGIMAVGLWFNPRPFLPEEGTAEKLIDSKKKFLQKTKGKRVLNLSPVSQWLQPSMDCLDNGNTAYRSTLHKEKMHPIFGIIYKVLCLDLTQCNINARNAYLYVGGVIEQNKYDFVLTDPLSEYGRIPELSQYEAIDTLYVCGEINGPVSTSVLLKRKIN